MPQTAYLDVKIGFDTEENEPSKVSNFFNFHPPQGFNFHRATLRRSLLLAARSRLREGNSPRVQMVRTERRPMGLAAGAFRFAIRLPYRSVKEVASPAGRGVPWSVLCSAARGERRSSALRNLRRFALAHGQATLRLLKCCF